MNNDPSLLDNRKMIQSPHDEQLETLCRQLRENADAIARQGQWPAASLELCADAGVFRWFLPAEVGGFAWTGADTIEGFLRLSGACLTTTFVLTQLTGACRRIANADNQQLGSALLPRMASGELRSTLGISHLTTSRRHLKRPALQAEQLDSGDYELNGISPWVTGGAHVDGLLTGAKLADGRELLAHVSLQADGVSVDASASLVALEGSKTGSVRFDRVRVDQTALLGEPTENVMQSGIGASTGGLQTSTLALGLAASAIEYLEQQVESRSELNDPASQLRDEWATNVACLQALASPGEHVNGLAGVCNSPSDLRIQCNSLALRATQAALVAAKGAGFVQGHPTGRWCQEALFFLVWSCPQPVSSASLCELARIE